MCSNILTIDFLKHVSGTPLSKRRERDVIYTQPAQWCEDWQSPLIVLGTNFTQQSCYFLGLPNSESTWFPLFPVFSLTWMQSSFVVQGSAMKYVCYPTPCRSTGELFKRVQGFSSLVPFQLMEVAQWTPHCQVELPLTILIPHLAHKILICMARATCLEYRYHT